MSRTPIAIAAACIFAALVASQASAQSPATTPADLELQQYFYVDFPQRLQAINNQISLAEAQQAYLIRRVDSYRPMRSFHQYGATYLADQSSQIAVLAAQQQISCLRDQKIALWRERQAIAQQMLSGAQ